MKMPKFPLPRFVQCSLVALYSVSGLAAKPESFQWPQDAGAAVCLTYDDSLASQLDIAFPQLEEAGLKATFFLQGNGSTMVDRVDDWRSVAKSGHELASHSLFHPCRKSLPGRDWVTPQRDLDQYNLERVVAELEITNTLLHAIDGEDLRTFAYPCGDTAVADGEQPLFSVANELFLASRGVHATLGSMKELKFSNTPGYDPSNRTYEETVSYLENCYKNGTVAILLMHGVGGDYLTIDAKLHRKILHYLSQNQDRYWVDTFKTVMTHTQEEFERLGWPIE